MTDNHTIRFATKEDTASLMSFIDAFWRKGHILSRDRELFEWQYGGENDRLNIVIGLDEEQRIQGMLGFIPYSADTEKDIALALWKANPATGFLGIRLIKYLIEEEPHRAIVCPGINPATTQKIYEYVGMRIGTMTHWYRLAERKRYLVATIADDQIDPIPKGGADLQLTRMRFFAEMMDRLSSDPEIYRQTVPYKSPEYLRKRYFMHPAYRYLVYACEGEEQKAATLFVFRVQEYDGAHVLRLVDCIGNTGYLARITRALDGLLDEWACEYVDAYMAGVDDETMLTAGWRKVTDGGDIIPDYFNPFERKNVEIHYSTTNPDAILFKGDGDQDRPN